MPVLDFEDTLPLIGKNVFIAPDAWVIGRSEVADGVAIFFGAVLRGDINKIIVGAGSNIQEHAVLHTSQGLGDLRVGAGVTVGHKAILHGCSISDNCIIGMNSVILDDAEIGEWSIVGAHSLVTMSKKFPPKSLIMGSPAKVVRELTDKELESIRQSALRYQEKAAFYRMKFTTDSPKSNGK